MNFLFNILLKATFILLLSGVLLFVLRKVSASFRHWIISLTFVGLLALPFCVYLLPHWEVEVADTMPLPFAEEINQSIVTPEIMPVHSPLAEHIITKSDVNSAVTTPVISPVKTAENSPINLSLIFVGLWIAGIVFFLTKLFMGIFSVHRLTQNSTPFESPYIADLQIDIPIFTNKTIHTAMVWGVQHPVILLPQKAENWSKETLQTVISHEMGHVKRGDYAMHILSLLSFSFYWFHPLVWWMKNVQLLEREKACDEHVLNAGLPNTQYAEQILAVAKNLSQRHTMTSQYVLPMAQVSQIKARILAILAFQKERFSFNKTHQFQWAAFYVSIILFLAAVTPIEQTHFQKITGIEGFLSFFPSQTTSTTLLDDIEAPTFEIATIELPNKVERPIHPPTATLPIDNAVLSTVNPMRSTLEIPMQQKPIPPTSTKTKAWYGNWHSGKSEFKIWVYGDYTSLSDFPYLEVNTPNDMIIIEEKRKKLFGSKTYRLTITKVPYDGGLVKEIKDGKIDSWQGGYTFDDPLYLFTIDDEWRFYGKDKLQWMTDNLPNIWESLAALTHDHSIWPEVNPPQGDMIQQQQKVIKSRIIPYDLLPKNDFERSQGWGSWDKAMQNNFDFSSFPVAPSTPFSSHKKGKQQKIGRYKRNKSASGGNAIVEGLKYGSVIRKIPKGSVLKDFNFHLHKVDFGKVTLNVSFYKVNALGIEYTLRKEPIQIVISEAGWVTVDVEKYNIAAEGDVLALIELVKMEGKKKHGDFFISHGKGDYTYFDDETNKDWGFWEGEFAFYFTVE